MRFMRADEIMTLFGTVTGGAATGYTDDWLVDGRPGRPAKAPGGSPAGATWVIVGPSSKLVTHVVVANHNLPAGSVVGITGGVTGTATAPALGANDIPMNFFTEIVTPATTNTITVDIDVADCIVGEVLAGRVREVDHGILVGAQIRYLAGSELPNGWMSSLPGYDEGIVQRAIHGQAVVTTANKAELEAWWEATRGSTRPSVLIPFCEDTDAWVGRLEAFEAVSVSNHWRVTFTFVEYPRSRW